jgi:ankyrin repeat protein
VKLLLDTGKFDVNYKQTLNQTPLLLAAERGTAVVVELLLSIGEAEMDSKDIFD